MFKRCVHAIPLALLLSLAACRHVVIQPPALPPPDLAAVAGRIICIDPGHGGPWPGAVAPVTGLRESDVNLEVALRLAQMLEKAGAQVVLTRGTDAALAADSLTADLTARATMANEVQAEAFVSVHHNASAMPVPDKNDLEVYYKQDDPWGSLELAQHLTHALAERLRPDAKAKRLLPGNYRVLRVARCPAVITEASYMTFGPNERFLSTERAWQAEAEAIAAGLSAYFRADPPRLSELRTEPTAEGHQVIEARFSSGLPIDPSSVTVMLDRQRQKGMCVPHPAGFTWTSPQPVPNGGHVARVRARNHEGGAFSGEFAFDVDRPAAFIECRQVPSPVSKESNPELLFELHVMDTMGYAIADGTMVRCNTGAMKATGGGRARFYLLLDDIKGETLVWSVPGTGCHTTHKPVLAEKAEWKTFRAREESSGAPVAGAVALSGTSVAAVTNGDGWAAVPAPVAEVRLECAGYEPLRLPLPDWHQQVRLARRFGPIPQAWVIVLDPEGGGRDPAVVGPTGLRASDVNMDIVRRVEAFLREAGVRVAITRRDDDERTELNRVRVANETQATAFVTVALGAHGATHIWHYPGSSGGTALAGAIANRLDAPVSSRVTYTLQQTPCPAVTVQPGCIASKTGENQARMTAQRQQWAEAIADGIVRWLLDKANR